VVPELTAREAKHMAKFGEMIREARRRAKKTLQAAANVIGVSIVYVSEVELGKRPPFSAERTEKLANFYETDVRPLLQAACRERGYLEIDMHSSSESQLRAVSGLARGGISEKQWEQICDVIEKGPSRN
jgi:transcriptional regulator with XRE-family HTH domain